jgi:hypothetical protein
VAARAGDRRRLGAPAKVAQNALDGTWLGDGGNEAHSAVAGRALERIDEKHAE